jgi:hypothetical protein
MLNPHSVIGKCLGRPTMPRMPQTRIGPAKDTFSQNMVRYNYFEVELENGTKVTRYGGSAKAVKKQLDDEKTKWLEIKEMPYGDVEKNLTVDERDRIRGHAKSVYSNRGVKKMPY